MSKARDRGREPAMEKGRCGPGPMPRRIYAVEYTDDHGVPFDCPVFVTYYTNRADADGAAGRPRGGFFPVSCWEEVTS